VIWKGQVRVGRSRCGSKRVNMGWTWCQQLFFYVCRCESIQVGAGQSGIRCRFTRVETDQNSLLWCLHSGNTVTHSKISNRVHAELKLYRPGSTRIYLHRNACQFLGPYSRSLRIFRNCGNSAEWFRRLYGKFTDILRGIHDASVNFAKFTESFCMFCTLLRTPAYGSICIN
jgi:hypothetical protein